MTSQTETTSGLIKRRSKYYSQKPLRTQVFGVPIESQSPALPGLLQQALAYLTENCLHTEGIFRQPGKYIEEFQDALGKGRSLWTIVSNAQKNPKLTVAYHHTVAELLKNYLRFLPEPVIPFAYYHAFLGFQDNGSLKKLLFKLKDELPCNFLIVDRIVNLLHDIGEHFAETKMSIPALATLLGPCLLRPKIENVNGIIRDSKGLCNVMQVLIREYSFLFRNAILPLAEHPPELETRRHRAKNDIDFDYEEISQQLDSIRDVVTEFEFSSEFDQFQFNSMNSFAATSPLKKTTSQRNIYTFDHMVDSLGVKPPSTPTPTPSAPSTQPKLHFPESKSYPHFPVMEKSGDLALSRTSSPRQEGTLTRSKSSDDALFPGREKVKEEQRKKIVEDPAGHLSPRRKTRMSEPGVPGDMGSSTPRSTPRKTRVSSVPPPRTQNTTVRSSSQPSSPYRPELTNTSRLPPLAAKQQLIFDLPPLPLEPRERGLQVDALLSVRGNPPARREERRKVKSLDKPLTRGFFRKEWERDEKKDQEKKEKEDKKQKLKDKDKEKEKKTRSPKSNTDSKAIDVETLQRLLQEANEKADQKERESMFLQKQLIEELKKEAELTKKLSEANMKLQSLDSDEKPGRKRADSPDSKKNRRKSQQRKSNWELTYQANSQLGTSQENLPPYIRSGAASEPVTGTSTPDSERLRRTTKRQDSNEGVLEEGRRRTTSKTPRREKRRSQGRSGAELTPGGIDKPKRIHKSDDPLGPPSSPRFGTDLVSGSDCQPLRDPNATPRSSSDGDGHAKMKRSHSKGSKQTGLNSFKVSDPNISPPPGLLDGYARYSPPMGHSPPPEQEPNYFQMATKQSQSAPVSPLPGHMKTQSRLERDSSSIPLALADFQPRLASSPPRDDSRFSREPSAPSAREREPSPEFIPPALAHFQSMAASNLVSSAPTESRGPFPQVQKQTSVPDIKSRVTIPPTGSGPIPMKPDPTARNPKDKFRVNVPTKMGQGISPSDSPASPRIGELNQAFEILKRNSRAAHKQSKTDTEKIKVLLARTRMFISDMVTDCPEMNLVQGTFIILLFSTIRKYLLYPSGTELPSPIPSSMVHTILERIKSINIPEGPSSEQPVLAMRVIQQIEDGGKHLLKTIDLLERDWSLFSTPNCDSIEQCFDSIDLFIENILNEQQQEQQTAFQLDPQMTSLAKQLAEDIQIIQNNSPTDWLQSHVISATHSNNYVFMTVLLKITQEVQRIFSGEDVETLVTDQELGSLALGGELDDKDILPSDVQSKMATTADYVKNNISTWDQNFDNFLTFVSSIHNIDNYGSMNVAIHELAAVSRVVENLKEYFIRFRNDYLEAVKPKALARISFMNLTSNVQTLTELLLRLSSRLDRLDSDSTVFVGQSIKSFKVTLANLSEMEYQQPDLKWIKTSDPSSGGGVGGGQGQVPKAASHGGPKIAQLRVACRETLSECVSLLEKFQFRVIEDAKKQKILLLNQADKNLGLLINTVKQIIFIALSHTLEPDPQAQAKCSDRISCLQTLVEERTALVPTCEPKMIVQYVIAFKAINLALSDHRRDDSARQASFEKAGMEPQQAPSPEQLQTLIPHFSDVLAPKLVVHLTTLTAHLTLCSAPECASILELLKDIENLFESLQPNLVKHKLISCEKTAAIVSSDPDNL